MILSEERQEEVEREVFRKLAEQGGPSIVEKGNFASTVCQYRSGNRRCAAGHLLSEDLLNHVLKSGHNETDWYNLPKEVRLKVYKDLVGEDLIPKMSLKSDLELADYVHCLQEAHDSAAAASQEQKLGEEGWMRHLKDAWTVRGFSIPDEHQQ